MTGCWFRGLDALDLARDWDFEDVCELLWAWAGRVSRRPPVRCPPAGRGGVAGGARGARGGHGRAGGAPARHLSRWNGCR